MVVWPRLCQVPKASWPVSHPPPYRSRAMPSLLRFGRRHCATGHGRQRVGGRAATQVWSREATAGRGLPPIPPEKNRAGGRMGAESLAQHGFDRPPTPPTQKPRLHKRTSKKFCRRHVGSITRQRVKNFSRAYSDFSGWEGWESPESPIQQGFPLPPGLPPGNGRVGMKVGMPAKPCPARLSAPTLGLARRWEDSKRCRPPCQNRRGRRSRLRP